MPRAQPATKTIHLAYIWVYNLSTPSAVLVTYISFRSDPIFYFV